MDEGKNNVKKTKVGDGTPGPGRPKGVPNKSTTALKDAILAAAEQAGGKDGLIGYLKKQAEENPGPFMALVGKVLPLQVAGDPNNPLHVSTQLNVAGLSEATLREIAAAGVKG